MLDLDTPFSKIGLNNRLSKSLLVQRNQCSLSCRICATSPPASHLPWSAIGLMPEGAAFSNCCWWFFFFGFITIFAIRHTFFVKQSCHCVSHRGKNFSCMLMMPHSSIWLDWLDKHFGTSWVSIWPQTHCPELPPRKASFIGPWRESWFASVLFGKYHELQTSLFNISSHSLCLQLGH